MSKEAMEGEEVEEEILNLSDSICQRLIAAFLAMEPADCLISLARECGGGSITRGVQKLILDQCVNNVEGRRNANHLYIKKFLKKLIVAIESSSRDVLDGLYERYVYYTTFFKEDSLLKGNTRVYRSISFLFPNGCSGDQSSGPLKLVVPLQCSVNMLEGDTGCCIWPSSLFLSEFILSYPEIFSNKSCFEVGSGVGLVGISLSHANASKVILSDGDLSTLANLKFNLELNQLSAETLVSRKAFSNLNLIECKYLHWESASEEELQGVKPDIVLGADVIYDPSCFPYLVRVLAILLRPNEFRPHQLNERYHIGLTENCINDKVNEANDARSDFNQLRNHEHLSIIGDDNQKSYTFFSKDTLFQCDESEFISLKGKASNENGRGRGTQYDTIHNGASNGESQVKQDPVAYLATVIRNIDTFNYFLGLANKAYLSVVDITEAKQPSNLLPYMHSYDRSSVRLYAVSFTCNEAL